MLGSAMASLASHVAEFRPLAMKLVPSAELSEQSVSILRQLVASGSKGFLCIKTLGGSSLCLDRGGNIDHHESRFLDDDLNVLVSLDLLSVKNNSQRGGWYGITRNAVRLLESIDGKESG
jgi:hypothetical protein